MGRLFLAAVKSPKRVKALGKDSAAAGSQETPEGASGSCGIITTPHELCCPSGWPIWGTFEEAVCIFSRSTDTTLGECRERYQGDGGKWMERETKEYGMPQYVESKCNANRSRFELCLLLLTKQQKHFLVADQGYQTNLCFVRCEKRW